MTDLGIPGVPTLADIVALRAGVQAQVADLARTVAAVMADPRTLPAGSRPVTMGRRMAVVVTVNPGPPLTADVELNGIVLPGVSPQSTYRPQVDDIVWLEFLGPDPHISAPITSDGNRSWTALSLTGGWSTYGGVTPGYWRDPLGMVHLRGIMAGGANGVFSSLPSTYHPSADRAFSVPTSDGVAWNHSLIVARSSGNLEFIGPATATETFIDGVHFRVD